MPGSSSKSEYWLWRRTVTHASLLLVLEQILPLIWTYINSFSGKFSLWYLNQFPCLIILGNRHSGPKIPQLCEYPVSGNGAKLKNFPLYSLQIRETIRRRVRPRLRPPPIHEPETNDRTLRFSGGVFGIFAAGRSSLWPECAVFGEKSLFGEFRHQSLAYWPSSKPMRSAKF